jgi:hypothetical protein
MSYEENSWESLKLIKFVLKSNFYQKRLNNMPLASYRGSGSGARYM